VGLAAYQRKRNFARTSEPPGRVTKIHARRFVVHEHHASHLHYDFRLEMGGVLKSWAVPKEPSLDPRQKRLAVRVEDHPVEYLTFRGQIAEGNYGAGEVKIWDTGPYAVSGTDDPLHQLDAGKLSVVLHGKKLRGEFHLVRMKGKAKQWLLIKGSDASAEAAEQKRAVKHVNSQDEPARMATKRSQQRPSIQTATSSLFVTNVKKTPEPMLHIKTGAPETAPTSQEHEAVVKTAEHAAHERDVTSSHTLVALPQALRAEDLRGDLTLKVAGHTVTLTHLERLYWPADGYRKGDLLRYYFTVAPTFLPYLRARPLILKRYPNGISGQSFYQHDVDAVPDFVTTFSTPAESGKVVDYAVCNNLATLLYLVNLGTIAPHPWHSRVASIDCPDWIVFDLDPPNDMEFSAVQELAVGLKTVLDRLGLDSYAKTSGASGLHVYVPIAPLYSYTQVAQFAELVARQATKAYPQLSTLERSLKKRAGGKIYLDHLQNARGKSVVAPYSVRAEAGATVSTPITWSEVEHPLSPHDFTIATLPQRLTRHGDLFAPVLTQKQELGEAIMRLEDLLQQGRRAVSPTRTRRPRTKKRRSV
jgi:DNA ligase D-like protein (predicted polymerase)/DNA ligase D-like protein (predicted 3'-phosphoesterase)